MQTKDYKKYVKNNDIIIQIGSYDGVECEQEYGLRDLIMHNNYTVHLIEPLKEKFEELKNNYSKSKSNIIYHNFAIYNKNGEETFFINSTESSFIRHKDKGSILVKTKTFYTFLNDNLIENFDLLFLDVEGVEDTIIKDLFDNTKIRPKIIRYEFPHINNEKELIKIIELNDYIVYNCCYASGDRLCIRKDLIDVDNFS